MPSQSEATNPLVSAVITTYKRPQRCKRALRSVGSQTYSPLEIIVVEDGSNTGIDKWLADKFPSATYVRHETNQGLAAARNTGLDKADGEYIAYLDDDDEWKPERITRQVDLLRSIPEEGRADVGVVYCGSERRTPEGELIAEALPKNEGKLATAIREHGASTLPSTFLFDRMALESVDGFDESLPSSIDHDIWMALATAGYRVLTVDEPLVVTYISPGSEQMTSDTIPRIYGVKAYIDKWTPTYVEWFGKEEGERYAERYFADVITDLARTKAQSRSFFELGQSVCAIFAVCTDRSYAAATLFWDLLAPIAVAPLPTSIIAVLKRIRDVMRS